MVSAEKEAGGGQMYKRIFFTLSKYIQTSNRNTAGMVHSISITNMYSYFAMVIQVHVCR